MLYAAGLFLRNLGRSFLGFPGGEVGGYSIGNVVDESAEVVAIHRRVIEFIGAAVPVREVTTAAGGDNRGSSKLIGV
jgi:hypothetical protein